MAKKAWLEVVQTVSSSYLWWPWCCWVRTAPRWSGCRWSWGDGFSYYSTADQPWPHWVPVGTMPGEAMTTGAGGLWCGRSLAHCCAWPRCYSLNKAPIGHGLQYGGLILGESTLQSLTSQLSRQVNHTGSDVAVALGIPFSNKTGNWEPCFFAGGLVAVENLVLHQVDVFLPISTLWKCGWSSKPLNGVHVRGKPLIHTGYIWATAWSVITFWVKAELHLHSCSHSHVRSQPTFWLWTRTNYRAMWIQ